MQRGGLTYISAITHVPRGAQEGDAPVMFLASASFAGLLLKAGVQPCPPGVADADCYGAVEEGQICISWCFP